MESSEGQDFEAHPKAVNFNSSESNGREKSGPRVTDVTRGGSVSGFANFKDTFNKLIWHGGSVYDAWFTAAAAQVGQVILTMPTSYAQMGIKFGIVFHLFYVTCGVWTCYLLARLYLEFRHRREREGIDFKNHVIQYHEVLGALVGPWTKRVVLLFNVLAMSAVATVQITACASNAYYISSHLDKQQWALVFGGVSMLTVLLPSFHNFRILSFLGILTTTYTAWYMFIAALRHGQAEGVKHTGPNSFVQFFTGTTNILFASGGHSITVEIMHAMWQPRKYKAVYAWSSLYILSITMPHCIAMSWAFGDILFDHGNALSVLPVSNARTTALIFMIIHQAVAFALYVMPLYFMWEKLFGIHQAWFPLRVVMRLPVAAVLWFVSLAAPFFGPLNSIFGAIMSVNTFVLPCVAYLYVFWTPQARQSAAEKSARFIPGWRGMVLVNICVAVAIAVLGTSFGFYASIRNVIDQIHTFGLFDKCFQC